MYQVRKTEYGLYFRVSGTITAETSKQILDETNEILKNLQPGFTVFSDLRYMELLSPETQAVCVEVQKQCLKAGVERVAVIVADKTVLYQFKRLALESESFDFHRYIDSSNNPDWEAQGLQWITEGLDPDAEWHKAIAARRAR